MSFPRSTGGTVIDGTGAERFTADVGITGDRIVAVSRTGIDPSEARDVIDASGLVVTPGFIDNHAHVQQSIADYPLSENFLRQGITTLVASLHSGDQPWPLDDFASNLEMAPNVAFFAGHTWTRRQVLGMEDRSPTPEELEEMTSMPARWLGQSERGVIAEGMLADVAVFDPEVIQDRATYSDPHQYSVGIENLLVNGVPVIRDGGITGEKPGQWIRGPARRPIS